MIYSSTIKLISGAVSQSLTKHIEGPGSITNHEKVRKYISLMIGNPVKQLYNLALGRLTLNV